MRMLRSFFYVIVEISPYFPPERQVRNEEFRAIAFPNTMQRVVWLLLWPCPPLAPVISKASDLPIHRKD